MDGLEPPTSLWILRKCTYNMVATYTSTVLYHLSYTDNRLSQKTTLYKSHALPAELRRQIGTECLLFRLSDDLNASHFHHFRDLYTPDSHQVGKMRTVYRLRVSYIVIYSRFQAKCPCGFRRCLLLHCPYLRYSDFTLRVPSGYIFQQHNRIVSQCVQHFCFFTLINP